LRAERNRGGRAKARVSESRPGSSPLELGCCVDLRALEARKYSDYIVSVLDLLCYMSALLKYFTCLL
jgi:hypothetical protein